MLPVLPKLVDQYAERFSVDPALIYAVMFQESGGNPDAVRFEPQFFIRYIKGKSLSELGGYVPKKCSNETEKILRSMSFGLMQIMGQVARERGFSGEYLTELLDPALNLEFSVKQLSKCLLKGGSTEKGLLLYNGGANKEYPLKIQRILEDKEYEFLQRI